MPPARDHLRGGDAAVAFLERHRAGRVDALTDRLVAMIRDENPRYQGDLVPVADLRASCRANISRVLELLALAVVGETGADGQYDAARATGRQRAGQGLPLDDVLRSYRFGGRLIWDDLVEEAADALDQDGLRVVGTHLWQVVDETSAQVAAAYHATERDRLRADEQQRAELWEGLLGGRAADPAFAREAGRSLDLPVSGRYLVVALAAPWTGPAPLVAGGATVRWVRRGTVGVVLLGRARTASADEAADVAAADAAGAADVAAAIGTHDGTAPASGAAVVGGHSRVVTGLPALERGLREALLALRAARGTPGVVAYDDRLPEALLLDAPDAAARLVDLWLSPVLALPEAEARPLLETLAAWVAEGGSTTRTAQSVPCHRNTVLNRLARVSRLLGVTLGEGPPPLELALALRAERLGVTRPGR